MIFLENKSSCACLFSSRLNDNFHWYVQACMTIKSLLSVEAEAFTQLTTENSEVSQQRVWFQTLVLLVNHWYKLVNSNELWRFQFGFLENYILVEKTYFTNYVEWIENKVMVLNSTNKHLGKSFGNFMALKIFLLTITSIMCFFVKQTFCCYTFYRANNNKLQRRDN